VADAVAALDDDAFAVGKFDKAVGDEAAGIATSDAEAVTTALVFSALISAELVLLPLLLPLLPPSLSVAVAPLTAPFDPMRCRLPTRGSMSQIKADEDDKDDGDEAEDDEEADEDDDG
jgi:hypothetical protein